MRRCTVYNTTSWYNAAVLNVTILYEGWLLQVDPRDAYPRCVVVNDKGQMKIEHADHVKVHVPESIPLLHGAPRRGDSENRAARPAATH